MNVAAEISICAKRNYDNPAGTYSAPPTMNNEQIKKMLHAILRQLTKNDPPEVKATVNLILDMINELEADK